MGQPRVFIQALVCAVLVVPPAGAEIQAVFRVDEINSGCLVDDQDPWPSGDPERYFRMGVFDSSFSSVLNVCHAGCWSDGDPSTLDGRTLDHCTYDEGCGSWNFPNTTLSKIIPDQSGAYFYFGLWDRDDDADDSLGDHWVFLDSPVSTTALNNNVSPYYADVPISTICGGRDVEGIGDSGNFEVTFNVSFQDTTAPTAPGLADAQDDGLSSVDWDNDTTLSFTWIPGSDANSGISGHEASLWSVLDQVWVFLGVPSPAEDTLTVCESGCDVSFAPQHGDAYLFRTTAINGEYPLIDNPSATVSGTRSIGVDLVDPFSAFVSPPASTWVGAEFSVETDDGDSGSGLSASSCEQRVLSVGVETVGWTTRACDGTFAVPVGPAGACRDEGPDTCRVELRSTDLSRRSSGTVARSFSVDVTPDDLGQVQAATSAGGTVIVASTWQPDNDPYISWTPPTSTSPIAGYSVAVDEMLDCIADVTGPAYQFPADALTDGMHLIHVRAIDEAGNCGATATYDLWVDTSGAAGPGSVQSSLRIERIDPVGDLDLSWQPSCAVLASDFAIYEGALGAWYSHVESTCTTGGATQYTLSPAGGNRYYLVVPRTSTESGSYGVGVGIERPAAVGACVPQAPVVNCP